MNLEGLRVEYNGLYGRLGKYAELLVSTVRSLVRNAELSPSLPVGYRIKTWDSIAEKLARKQRNIDSVLEVGDLVGVRVVMPFHHDVRRIEALLPGYLLVLDEENKIEAMSDREFGYQSVHFLVSRSDSPIAQPVFREFEGFRAEIQVRTLCQHVWAEVSHALTYKVEDSVPPELRRSLNAAAALLEVTDNQLALIHTRHEAIRREAERDRRAPLTVDGVKAVLASKLPVRFEPGDADEPVYEQMIGLLHFRRIFTIGGLRTLLDRHLDHALRAHAWYVEQNRGRPMQRTESLFGLRRDVMASETDLVRLALDARDAMAATPDPGYDPPPNPELEDASSS